MTLFEIVFSPEALQQLARIHAWWREQRAGAPDLFDDELLAAVETLAITPRMGSLVPHPRISDDIRRILMPRSRYHIYYTVNARAETVWIVAVWHCSRGHGPRL